jgi:uncharacterized Tic20 family protein
VCLEYAGYDFVILAQVGYAIICQGVAGLKEQRMQPTEDERVLAALSHASIVANIVNLVGIIATAVIWTMQRERSRYVRAHALQALVYQGTVLVVGMLLGLAWGLCLVLSLLPVMLRPDLYDMTNPPRSFWLALLGLALPIGFGILGTIYGLYGAYRVYSGRPFRYPLVGRLVRRDLMTLTSAPTAAAPAAEAPAPARSAGDTAPPAAAAEGEPPSVPGAAAPPARRRERRRPPEQ